MIVKIFSENFDSNWECNDLKKTPCFGCPESSYENCNWRWSIPETF